MAAQRAEADYEMPEAGMTLAEGIAEYYARYPGLSDVDAMPPAAQAFFRCHDVAHVVYGCGITLPDEAVVKISSVFGTSAGLGVLQGYRLEDSRRIYTTLDRNEVRSTILGAAVIVPRTIARCLRQHAKWPWPQAGHARWLDVPLVELRATFGIRVARG